MVEKIMSKYPVFEDFKNPNVWMWLFAYGVLVLALAFFIGNFWAALCFWLAAYAVIWNDAVQTLMTYIHSNSDIPRRYLFSWVAAVLLWVIWYWYLTNGWDISYGRLEAKWYAVFEVEWYVAIFPLILVFLTRFRGIPVSTSLLMLSIFSTSLLFEKIVMKSALWYLVAFLASFFMWLIVEYILKKAVNQKWQAFSFLAMMAKAVIAAVVVMFAIWFAVIPMVQGMFPAIEIPVFSNFQIALYSCVAFLFTLGILYESKADDSLSRSSIFWRLAQTFTTVLLFGTWLMHDMVNIAVFLPRWFNLEVMLLISVLFILWLAYTFHINGWPVWNIVTKKTSTNEIIAATMIDLVYFVVLLIFKEWSNIPMSTTWVFVWLLAGRQFAIRAINRIDVIEWSNRMNVAFKESWKDFSKIMVGLGISVFALIVVRYLTGT